MPTAMRSILIQRWSLSGVSGLIYWRILAISFIILSITPLPATCFINIPTSIKKFLGFETCSHPYVRDAVPAVASLRESLEADLFGQHLAKKTILTALKMHLDDPSPKKALVISLHGWAGCGKTFTTQLVMKSLYDKGEQSDYVKYFSATFHFPDPRNVTQYKEYLQNEVIGTVRKCEKALFVFDEVDKLPPGLLDVLKPLIKPGGRLAEGVNVKKAVFILLSNSGATKINEITRKAKEAGMTREDLELKDFEEALSSEAFENSESGGLYKSELIEKILVDWFIPFLPLERTHVINCIKRDSRNIRDGVEELKGTILLENGIQNIANRMTYWPEKEKWFSTTGCKRVENLVKLQLFSELDSGSRKNEL